MSQRDFQHPVCQSKLKFFNANSAVCEICEKSFSTEILEKLEDKEMPAKNKSDYMRKIADICPKVYKGK